MNIFLAIQIVTAILFISLLIYLLYNFAIKLLMATFQEKSESYLILLHLYALIDGIIWNIFNFNRDGTLLHVANGLDWFYFTIIVIDINAVYH